MQESIFTKIIKGKIPCHKVHEDDQAIVILDINPLNPGHCLVIPKFQTAHLWDIDDETYQHLMNLTKQVATRLREVLNPPRIAMFVDGYNTPDHSHIHVLPAYEGFEHTISKHLDQPETKPDHPALAAMAAKLAF